VLPLRELREHERLQLKELSLTSIGVPSPLLADRNLVWEHCRNALGIARLLVQEHRSADLVDTACHLAVDCACRVAMEEAGLEYAGDPGDALHSLAAPRALWPLPADLDAASRLRGTERVVVWVATFLKSEAPHRSWGI
jgi:hypothetical protein